MEANRLVHVSYLPQLLSVIILIFGSIIQNRGNPEIPGIEIFNFGLNQKIPEMPKSQRSKPRKIPSQIPKIPKSR